MLKNLNFLDISFNSIPGSSKKAVKKWKLVDIWNWNMKIETEYEKLKNIETQMKSNVEALISEDWKLNQGMKIVIWIRNTHMRNWNKIIFMQFVMIHW